VEVLDDGVCIFGGLVSHSSQLSSKSTGFNSCWSFTPSGSLLPEVWAAGGVCSGALILNSLQKDIPMLADAGCLLDNVLVRLLNVIDLSLLKNDNADRSTLALEGTPFLLDVVP
jgi:hypothetical protein